MIGAGCRGGGRGPSQDQRQLRRGDEVCIVYDGRLVLGTLETQQTENMWGVKWLHEPGFKIPCLMQKESLTLTERPLFRGCKVRRVNAETGTGGKDDMVGVCRTILLSADLRLVGTNTILPDVSISQFRNLKEYKQKSVVYNRGWLGIITGVQRKAYIRYKTSKVEARCTLPLADIQKLSSELMVEPSYTDEQITISNFSLKNAVFLDDNGEQVSAPVDIRQTFRQTAFIEDVEVIRVKVKWIHQVDLENADHPPTEYKGEKLKTLTLVKEENEEFQLGNLGRHKNLDNLLVVNIEDWERNFVRINMNSRIKELKKYTSIRAYDSNPEKRAQPGKTAVGEIIHLCSTGDIMWQDGTTEFVKSCDLIVLDSSILQNCKMPSDFLYSPLIKESYKDYYQVLLSSDLKNKTVTVRTLKCCSPADLIENRVQLSEDQVEPHPHYRYFNETNTVVVLSQFGNSTTRVGHVQQTNPSGKVLVRWIDSGREEWCWPAECSIFTVKGFDIECILNLINDEEELNAQSKFKKALDIFKQKVEIVWKNDSSDEAMRKTALNDLTLFLSDLKNAEEKLGEKPEKVSVENIHRVEEIGKLLMEKSHRDSDVTEVMRSWIADLLQQSSILLNSIETQSVVLSESNKPIEPPTPMEVDKAPLCFESSMSDIFSDNVIVEDCHPEGHEFGKRTTFEPQHQKSFIRVIRTELETLRRSLARGIIVKAFGDRFDLFSILILGPEKTPYENSIYLFDVSLPSEYPAVPPKFHFHSYGAGRLNPNLYTEGKVCVSLLGTWQGRQQEEKWMKDSTIFQVLLSIQALILVSEPYHNEPGNERDRYTKDAAKDNCLLYNHNLMPKVVRMIINQVQMPMNPWKNETLRFYMEEIPKFISRWEKWLATPDEASLSEDEKPGYALYPMSPVFISLMKTALESLRFVFNKIKQDTKETSDSSNVSGCSVMNSSGGGDLIS